MVRNVTSAIYCRKIQLAVCCRAYSGYEPMRYHKVISFDYVSNTLSEKVGEKGYFVNNLYGTYDFFPMDEFKEFFIIVDNCDDNKVCKHLNMRLEWLHDNRNIGVYITPSITDDGYSFSYSLEITYPFTNTKTIDGDLLNYELAAKKALMLIREKCIKRYGRDGVKKWLNRFFLK